MGWTAGRYGLSQGALFTRVEASRNVGSSDGYTAPALHFVDDEHDAELLGDAAHAPDELGVGRDDSTFSLHETIAFSKRGGAGCRSRRLAPGAPGGPCGGP